MIHLDRATTRHPLRIVSAEVYDPYADEHVPIQTLDEHELNSLPHLNRHVTREHRWPGKVIAALAVVIAVALYSRWGR